MMPDVWPFGAIVSIVTGAHTRYFGIKSSKTPSTSTKNEKNAMSAERATPQHAYVQRFVNCPIYVHRKMGKKQMGQLRA